MYPLISEYIESIKSAEENFATLTNLRPVLDEDGAPVFSCGGFAVVFKMRDEQTGKFHAVKCFLKDQEGRAEAYRLIAEELEYVSSTFLTPIKYLDNELFVDSSYSDETEFPVLLMDWVEGLTLDKYIREHIDDQYELSLLAYQFSRLAMWLMPQPFAHGDLKPDNILVKYDGTLVLVDYDGMYVPAMKGQKARELGSPDFRHPSRTGDDFDEHIDDFSLVSILLSLKAISLRPELLEQYGASDRMLFSEKDYRDISQCKLLKELYPSNDSELNLVLSLFTLALERSTLVDVSFKLLNLGRPYKPDNENLSTDVTEEDLSNAWEDKYGVKYSQDKKRLLKGVDMLSYHIFPGTKVICSMAFCKCKTLKKVIIPDGLITIGSSAFYECNSLSTIVIPNSVANIASSTIEIVEGEMIRVDKSSKGNIFKKNYRSMEEECSKMGTKDFRVNTEKHSFFLGGNAYYIGPSLQGKSAKQIAALGKEIMICDASINKKRWIPCLYIPSSGIFKDCKNLKQLYIPLGKREFYELLLPEHKDILIEQDNYDNLRAEVTKDDLVNAWMDNQGALYSSDWKRLLRGPSSKVVKSMVVTNHNFKKTDMWVSKPVISQKTGKTTYWCSFDLFEHGILLYLSRDIWKDLSIVNPDTLWEVFNSGNYIVREARDSVTNKWLMDENNSPIMMITPMRETVHGSWDSDNDYSYFKELVETTDYSIKQGTECICERAFEDCVSLKSLSIPKSVKSIGEFAFDECVSLTSIFIPIGTISKFEELLPGYKDILVEKSN